MSSFAGRDKNGWYYRGTFKDEAVAKAKAASCGGIVRPFRRRGKLLFAVKSKTLEAS
ncbi:MAG: hypothetical protein P4K78_10675 [Terracidiphilus sp.]|nr:hypothetical protein [Terracidiphilus sp.]